MGITFRYLSGNKESLDKVIAYHLNNSWNNSNTLNTSPVFESATDEPDFAAQTDKSGINKIHINIISRRKVPTTEGNEPNGDTVHQWLTTITITIDAESVALLTLFEDEVNRILWTVAPNNAIRLKKSNGTEDSEVFMFEENELEFERVDPEQPMISDLVSSQAVLGLHWYKDKT